MGGFVGDSIPKLFAKWMGIGTMMLEAIMKRAPLIMSLGHLD
jgi:hypothetical protein